MEMRISKKGRKIFSSATNVERMRNQVMCAPCAVDGVLLFWAPELSASWKNWRAYFLVYQFFAWIATQLQRIKKRFFCAKSFTKLLERYSSALKWQFPILIGKWAAWRSLPLILFSLFQIFA